MAGRQIKQVFDIEPDLYIVLYCGLCNSAGWVDTYNGKRAILYRIDKIAELSGIYSIEQIAKLNFNHIENAVIEFLKSDK